MDRSTPSSAGNPTAQSAETLRSLGEFGLIDQITQDLPRPSAVSVGVGDDAAVFLVDGSAVVSTDMLVEGVHFRRDWSGAADIGHKSVAVNVADLEAMGATPISMVIALALPSDIPVAWVREFSNGVREEAERAGIALVGGDTTSGPVVTVSVTVIGQTQGRQPVLRGGARPGQVVAVRGRLGWAAAGLAVLGRGFRSPRAAVDAQRVPQPPYGAGRQAAEAGATAMLDVSDGLMQDLGHIAEASDVVIDVDAARLRVDDPVRAVAAATGKDPLLFVLTGGEDHALAACFDLGDVPDDWDVIGVVRARAGEELPGVLLDGKALDMPLGWDHFGS